MAKSIPDHIWGANSIQHQTDAQYALDSKDCFIIRLHIPTKFSPADKWVERDWAAA